MVIWAYRGGLYLLNLCQLWTRVVNHETVREYVSEASSFFSLAPRIDVPSDGENTFSTGLLQLNLFDQTHTLSFTHSPPPASINNHDSGSPFSWWIWHWLYGFLLHLQGADMVGFLRLDSVSWSEWIDMCIDNSPLVRCWTFSLWLQQDRMLRLEIFEPSMNVWPALVG